MAVRASPHKNPKMLKPLLSKLVSGLCSMVKLLVSIEALSAMGRGKTFGFDESWFFLKKPEGYGEM